MLLGLIYIHVEDNIRWNIKKTLKDTILENFKKKFINVISEIDILEHLKGVDSLLILIAFFIFLEEICETSFYLKSFVRMILQVNINKFMSYISHNIK